MNRGNPLFESPTPMQGNNGRRTTGNTRATATQPTYDFLTGAASPHRPAQPATTSSQSQFRKSLIVSASGNHNNDNKTLNKIDISNEGLRSEVNSLRYELQTLKADRELERIRHEEQLRAAEVRAEEKAKLADAAETDKRFLFEKQKSLGDELGRVRDAAENQKREHEKTIRQLRAKVSELDEIVDERAEDFRTLERQTKRQTEELETRNKALNVSLEGLKKEYDENISTLQDTQQRCSVQEVEIEALRNEVVGLKGASGDLESLQVLKRELSQQMAQQKSSLEGKLRMMDTLREELSEKELQLTILRNEKKAWSAFLEDNEGGLSGFNSPQDIARALMEEKVEKAELLERLGRVEPELAESEEVIERTERERDEVKQELEKVVESYKKLHASRARIERNRQIALKEVEMLRDQLKSYSTEESNLMDGNYDTQKTKHIEELESLIETYKRENETLLTDISRREKETSSASPDSLKRAHEEITTASSTTTPNPEETSEKLGQLTRRARAYQEEVTKLRKAESLLKKELKAAMSRIKSLEESSSARMRILELKDNPTARSEAIKLTHLRTLQEENSALLAQLQGKMHEVGKVVPAHSLKAAQHQLEELKQQVDEKEKRMARLKQIWTAKSVEWRQAVHSIVGILFDFMPNGRVRVSSKEWYDDGQGDDGDVGKEPGIIFDGEQGTMKISPEEFSWRIGPLVKEWVEDKGDIPGLIAALNMQRKSQGGDRMEE
ncbi:spindle assembly checkpoint component Mad1 [Terfezia claveryi]|nr:spindle assembly checkpoint component Mad1 [Terfezia claveryi]